MGAEGLLEPMRYQDTEGAHHYACPYSCPENLVDFRLIEGMWGHIRQEHGMANRGTNVNGACPSQPSIKMGSEAMKRHAVKSTRWPWICEKYKVDM